MINFIPALDKLLEGNFVRNDGEFGMISYDNARMTLLINPNCHSEINGNGRAKEYHGSNLRLAFKGLKRKIPDELSDGGKIKEVEQELNHILNEYGTKVSQAYPMHEDGGMQIIRRILLFYQSGTPACNIVNSISAVMEYLQSRLE